MAVGDRDAGRCAFFAPEPISRSLLSGARNVSGPAELLDALSDSIRLGRVIRAINQYALAKINHRDNTIMLHRLVQRVFVNQMGPQEAAELRHCGHQPLANSDPQGPELAARWPRYLDLLPHVLYSDIVDCDDSWVRDLILNVLEFLFRWGDNRGYLRLAERAVESWTDKPGLENVFGENDVRTLASLSAIAVDEMSAATTKRLASSPGRTSIASGVHSGTASPGGRRASARGP